MNTKDTVEASSHKEKTIRSGVTKDELVKIFETQKTAGTEEVRVFGSDTEHSVSRSGLHMVSTRDLLARSNKLEVHNTNKPVNVEEVLDIRDTDNGVVLLVASKPVKKVDIRYGETSNPKVVELSSQISSGKFSHLDAALKYPGLNEKDRLVLESARDLGYSIVVSNPQSDRPGAVEYGTEQFDIYPNDGPPQRETLSDLVNEGVVRIDKRELTVDELANTKFSYSE